MYQRDIARSAVTAESMRTPLVERWVLRPAHSPQPAWEDPQPVAIEGYRELPRMKFDDAFHVAVVGDSLYFGSSADFKVYCINVRNGRERWSFFTGGPVRFAPQVWQDKVYAVSDDGYLYCLRAKDGKEVWRFRAAPRDDHVMGNGKMISLWPLRTGVLIDNGVVYCSAGIFPAEGVHVCALSAEDGKLLWRNGTSGKALQGYLLASASTLFAPMGRVSPCGFDRGTGKLNVGNPYFGKGTGGSYALLADNQVVSGSEQIIAYGQKNSRTAFAWFPGRRLVITAEASFMVSDKEMWSIDRKNYSKASLSYRTEKERRKRFERDLRNRLSRERAPKNALTAAIKRDEVKLAVLEKKPNTAATSGQLQKLAASLAQQRKNLAAFATRQAASEKQLEAIRTKEKESQTRMHAAIKWRVPCDTAESLIYTGRFIFAGGKNKVVAVETDTGKTHWSAEVHGAARGLAAAHGQLFVSTNSGAIHCFGPAGSMQLGEIRQEVDPTPFRKRSDDAVYRAAVDAVVSDTGIKRGLCLMYGIEDGRLALELARRTELIIYGVDSDAGKIEMARKALDSAGLYGKRVVFGHWPLDSVPYADYFANLIVSETALVTGRLPGNVTEMYRMLRPLGGAAWIGQPESIEGKVERMEPSQLRNWIQSAQIEGADVTEGGTWLKIIRGKLKGTTDWTHGYANAGNTSCSLDEQVKSPLGVLWFGAPGPTDIPNRHRSAAAPLCVNGILLVQGEHVLMGYDAYNGMNLWKRRIKGAMRVGLKHDSANLAASKESFFVAISRGRCLRIDPLTGRTLKTYRAPPSPKRGNTGWGYLATEGKLLFGSTQYGFTVSDSLFAIDIDTGKTVWTHEARSMRNMAIAVDGGKIFLVDSRSTPEGRKKAIRERFEKFEGLSGDELTKAEQTVAKPDVRTVVALDAAKGKKLWERPLEVSNCVRISAGGGELIVMVKDGVLLLCGQPWNGHFWQEFLSGKFSRRSLIALSVEDGTHKWSGKMGYRSRPLIVGKTIVAEPWAYHLQTGKPKMRENPITGVKERWQMSRPGHHCGPIAASAHTLAFRSGVIGFLDYTGDGGTVHFDGQRTGCHINFVSANGLLLIPEGSSGCMCAFPNTSTVVFKHREIDRTWGRYSVEGATRPVKHLAINLGAPGDRRGKDGSMWITYPRPYTGRLVLSYKMETPVYPGGGYFRRNPDNLDIRNTKLPWLFASGINGVLRCVLPLIKPGDGAAQYTVRLLFADLENESPGTRVFDIALQNKPVAKEFDIVREAGGKGRAVVKEFRNIIVNDKLTISFKSKQPRPARNQSPILQGIEVIREKVLNLGFTVPSFTLNNAEPQKTGQVRIANHQEQDFNGTLRVKAPAGFTASPAAQEVTVRFGSFVNLELKAALAGSPERGIYPIEIELIRKDGKLESKSVANIEHLADRGRVMLKAAEDAYVGKSWPKSNRGKTQKLLVDGGSQEMGDRHHHITYLKFKLTIPGKPLSALLRLRNANNPTSHGGNIHLIDQPWHEMKITYDTRPKPGKQIGSVGKVNPRQVLNIPLKIELEGMKELSLVVEPVNRDGTDYLSREGGKPAELIVEYQQ